MRLENGVFVKTDKDPILVSFFDATSGLPPNVIEMLNAKLQEH